MKTTTYAEVALLVGPFTQGDCVVVPARGEEGLKFLKEKYGDALVAFVYFDVNEIEFQGLKYTSEPHHQERIDVIKEEDFKKRITAEREELSNVLGDVIASLTGEAEPKVERPAHTLH